MSTSSSTSNRRLITFGSVEVGGQVDAFCKAEKWTFLSSFCGVPGLTVLPGESWGGQLGLKWSLGGQQSANGHNCCWMFLTFALKRDPNRSLNLQWQPSKHIPQIQIWSEVCGEPSPIHGGPISQPTGLKVCAMPWCQTPQDYPRGPVPMPPLTKAKSVDQTCSSKTRRHSWLDWNLQKLETRFMPLAQKNIGHSLTDFVMNSSSWSGKVLGGIKINVRTGGFLSRSLYSNKRTNICMY